MYNNNQNSFFIKWYGLLLILIAAMVVLGGFTRLTESGLSITEWQLFSGILPPLSEASWQELFSKYQKIPEFYLENPDMTLQGFKQIFWLEYLHRLLGRTLGLVFIIPFLYIVFNKKLRKGYLKQLTAILILLPLQGLIGWLMVKSGLQDRVDVSHIRLAIHLLMAFILFAIITYFMMHEIYKNRHFRSQRRVTKPAIICFEFIFSLIFLQITYGAFVAGLKAGLVYNSFPLMNQHFLPEEILYNGIKLDMLINDHGTVQFFHRIIAYTITLFAIDYYFFFKNKIGNLSKNMFLALLLLIFVQIFLGVITLLTHVNMYLAVIHQFMALIIVFFSTIILHDLRFNKRK